MRHWELPASRFNPLMRHALLFILTLAVNAVACSSLNSPVRRIMPVKARTEPLIAASAPTNAETPAGLTNTPSGQLQIRLPCPQAPPSQLAVGSRAFLPFLPRASHSLAGEPGNLEIEQGSLLPAGTEMLIVGGPVCQGDLVWWEVEVLQEPQRGWLPETSELGYAVLPLPAQTLTLGPEVADWGRATSTPASAAEMLSSEILYRDPFEEVSPGWPLFATQEVTTRIRDGEFEIHLAEPMWAMPVYLDGDEFSNVRVEIDVYVPAEPLGAQFGLLCRDGGDTGYQFQVSNEGEVYLYVDTGNRLTFVDGRMPDPTDAVIPNEFNRLAASCVGDQLAFYVNGTLVAEASDDRYTTGKVGFFGATDDQGDVLLRFDNFTVLAP